MAERAVHEMVARRGKDPKILREVADRIGADESLEEAGERCAAFLPVEARLDAEALRIADVEGHAILAKTSPEAREVGEAGQHGEFHFRDMRGFFRIEPRGANLDRPFPIAGEILACLQLHLVERLGREALYRMTEDGGDGGHAI